MSLKDINFKSVYRTEEDNILEDFYIPALRESVRYDRAVGFFSAGMLSYAAQGLSAFVGNDGYIRLIIGGELQKEDHLAIKSGYDMRGNLTDKIGESFAEDFERVIENTSDTLFFRRLEILSYLVANGRVDIKIALRRNGMYHEKIGVFTDAQDNKIIFQGSANETPSALLPDFNFESINVFESWRTELKNHFEPYLNGFEKLWENRSPNTFVIDFPDAAKRKLISIAKSVPKLITSKLESELFKEEDENIELQSDVIRPEVPQYLDGHEFTLKDHQRRALESWKAHDLRGVMKLATGAGKTITAIFGAVKIFESTNRLFVVIAVPYQSLADQWVEVLRKFNIFPVKCYESAAQWTDELKQKISLYNDKFLPFVCAVVVNRTMQSDNFQNLIRLVPEQYFLWIGDECHHHSAEKMLECLPPQADWRLGLSATPENYWNDAATDRLFDYYGSIVAEYRLKEALAEEILTPYKYYPILVDLTDAEAYEYEGISKKIAQIAAYNQSAQAADPETHESLKNLLIKRARILGKAENKLIALEQTLSGQRPKPLVLFYCGDGSVEDEESGEAIRQIEAVSSTLDRLGWRCSHFTAGESRAERQDILDSFRLGMIDAMVAMKCLDEGIDVPACRTAYILASSRNPKQFIQRRGRILRRSPGKEYAEIYDFIVKIPNALLENNEIEKKLLKAELNRAAEFASLAMNSLDTIRALRPILQSYNLEHLLANFIKANDVQ